MKKRDPHTVEISKSDLWEWLLFSMRYMLGRSSIGVWGIMQDIRGHAHDLGPAHIAQMGREVESELKLAHDLGHLLGMECDDHEWTAFAAWCKEWAARWASVSPAPRAGRR